MQWILIIPVLLAVTGCKEDKRPATIPGAQTQAQAMRVQGLVVRPQTLSADIRVPGSLLPMESAEIHPEVSGRIVELHLKEAGSISKGNLIAKLYDGDLQAQLRKLEVQLKIAEQTEKRQAQLLEIQGISQQDYDMSLLQVQTLKADMDILHEAIRKTEIRAPFSGRLGLKEISPGAYVTPATVLTTISQVDRLKLEFKIPERYSADLVNGQKVTFQIDGSRKNFEARVIATESRIDEATRSLTIRALVEDKDPGLIPGAFADVQIVLGRSDEALMIPNILVFLDGREKRVFVAKNGKVHSVQIETGVRDSSHVEVRSGLLPGDTAITSSLLFLRPGMDVQVTEVE